MSFEVSFPGGVAVEATYRGHTVRTDQPVEAGGADTAMSPFDLFLASIATCMGFYALRFCQQRELDTKGLGVTLTPIRVPEKKNVDTVSVQLRLPDAFPVKYTEAILRAVDQCAVKKHIMEPPQFDIGIRSTSIA
jgi:putative redox protein